MAKHPEQFTVEAWAVNAIAFIEDQSLTREFSDWCGGWPCPVSPQLVTAAPHLLQALDDALAALEGRVEGLDSTICCSGHGCGCQGASNRALLLHDLRSVASRARGEP